MKEPIVASYADVRHEIRDGDLLLFRRRDWLARLIAVAGRSQYVHAAMAGWWSDRLGHRQPPPHCRRHRRLDPVTGSRREWCG